MRKHTILFVATNESEPVRLALDEEARAIQVELERSGFRDCIELVPRWAVRPLDLLRELRRLKPTVVHFGSHGDRSTVRKRRRGQVTLRGTVGETDPGNHEHEQGLYFQGPDGYAQMVSRAALQETFGAAGASVKVVVLSGCYSEFQAESLLVHVDCVVGTNRSISDSAARTFSIGFYGGLGEHESIENAYRQGCAAISLAGLKEGDRPRLKVREGVDASQFCLDLAVSVVIADLTQTMGEVVQYSTVPAAGSGALEGQAHDLAEEGVARERGRAREP